jgi:hypothetical protein
MPCRLAVISGARVRISQRVNSENRPTPALPYGPHMSGSLANSVCETAEWIEGSSSSG